MNILKKHNFYIFASQFTLPSMVKMISQLSLDSFHSPSEENKSVSSIAINRYQSVRFLQWYAIDMLYEIITSCSYGKKDISMEETKILYAHYTNFFNKQNKQTTKKDIFLYLYTFGGEQLRFDRNGFTLNDFSREKYILEVLLNDNILDFKKEFKEETGLNTDNFSQMLFLIFVIFTKRSSYSVNEIETTCSIFAQYNGDYISHKNILHMIEQYSCDIEEVRKSKLKRQIFYAKPFIRIDNQYILSNIFLLSQLFSHSNYWILRNKYLNKKSQNFINEFGLAFESYVEDIFSFCLHKSKYKKIESAKTKNTKIADWHFKVDNYNFIIEQKSSLINIDAKQTTPNLDSAKKFLSKILEESILQLISEAKKYKPEKTIKIILLYEDYLLENAKYEHSDLNNRYNLDEFWILNINEFERLLMTLKRDKDLFIKIIQDKLSNPKLDIYSIMLNHNIPPNIYLEESCVYLYGISLIENLKKNFEISEKLNKVN